MTPEQYQQRLRVLGATCRREGRPVGEVRRSLGLTTLIGRDAEDLVARWRRLQAWMPGGALDGAELGDWAASRLVGTPDQVLEQLRGWEARRVEQVVCGFGGCRSRCSRTSSSTWPGAAAAAAGLSPRVAPSPV